jgi:hypothetical protein
MLDMEDIEAKEPTEFIGEVRPAREYGTFRKGDY